MWFLHTLRDSYVLHYRKTLSLLKMKILHKMGFEPATIRTARKFSTSGTSWQSSRLSIHLKRTRSTLLCNFRPEDVPAYCKKHARPSMLSLRNLGIYNAWKMNSLVENTSNPSAKGVTFEIYCTITRKVRFYEETNSNLPLQKPPPPPPTRPAQLPILLKSVNKN